MLTDGTDHKKEASFVISAVSVNAPTRNLHCVRQCIDEGQIGDGSLTDKAEMTQEASLG